MTKLLKFLSLIIGLGVALYISLEVYTDHDEDLNPEAKAFFEEKPAQPVNDLYIALVALKAPKTVQNTMAYARKAIKGDVAFQDMEQLRYKSLKDEPFLLPCITYEEEQSQQECANTSQAQELIVENALLLERYSAMLGREDLKNVSNSGKRGDVTAKAYMLNMQDIINLHHLLIYQWIKEAEQGQLQQAIRDWVEAGRFLKNIYATKMDLGTHSSWSFLLEKHFKSLPLLVDQAPEQAKQFSERIRSVLLDDYASLIDVKGLFQAEYQIWQSEIEDIEPQTDDLIRAYKPNATQNKFYAMAQDAIELSNLPATKSLERFKDLTDKYYCGFFCRVYNPAGDLLLVAQTHVFEYLAQVHAKTASTRMVVLIADAKMQGIMPEDMPEYLDNSSKDLFNPFTGQPFRWNKQEKALVLDQRTVTREVYWEN